MMIGIFCKDCGNEIDHYECLDGINHCPICFNTGKFTTETQDPKSFIVNKINQSKFVKMQTVLVNQDMLN
jgi:hypothetical protein